MFWRCISILIRPELTGNLIRFSVRVFITQIADHAAEPSAYSFAILTSMYILYIHWLQNSAQTKLANYIPLGWSNMWNTYVSSYLGPCSNCFAILILLVYFIRFSSTLFLCNRATRMHKLSTIISQNHFWWTKELQPHNYHNIHNNSMAKNFEGPTGALSARRRPNCETSFYVDVKIGKHYLHRITLYYNHTPHTLLTPLLAPIGLDTYNILHWPRAEFEI